MSSKRRIARLLVLISGALFLGILVGGLVVSFVATQWFGYQVLAVGSESMEPTLSQNDLVITRPVAIDSISTGEVIVFDSGETTKIPVIHRVLDVTEMQLNITDSKTGEVTTEYSYYLSTKGDANVSPDGQLVDASRLHGELWFTIPGAGAGFSNGSLQELMITIAAISALAWIGYELQRYFKRNRERNGTIADESIA